MKHAIEYLRKNRDIGFVILLSSYGSDAEAKMSERVKRLQALIEEHSEHPAPKVIGCLYDPEYDWLAIYDEETEMFLPANAALSA